MKHVISLKQRKEGKKPTMCVKYITIDKNQVNPTKIIDGWQVLKGDFSRYRQLLPKMQLWQNG